MNTPNSNFKPHPLFSKESLYGGMTEESLWLDDGVTRIRDFFEVLRCEDLREAWRDGDFPEHPQDWGMGDKLDAEYHEYLLGKHRRSGDSISNEEVARPIGALRGAPGDEPAPVLAIFDLRSGECHVSKDERTHRFSGSGNRIPGRYIKSFEVDIPLTALHENRPLESTSVCRFVILRPHVIGMLGEMLDADVNRFGPDGDLKDGVEDLQGVDIRNHDQSIDVIKRLVSDRSLLDPASGHGASHRRALWLSTVLGLASGLQGAPMVDGPQRYFEKQVPLKQGSPTLEGLTLGVLFIGP